MARIINQTGRTGVTIGRGDIVQFLNDGKHIFTLMTERGTLVRLNGGRYFDEHRYTLGVSAQAFIDEAENVNDGMDVIRIIKHKDFQFVLQDKDAPVVEDQDYDEDYELL